MSESGPSPIKLQPATMLMFSIIGALLIACEPKDVQPGLWLSGEEVTEQVNDWRFTNEIDEVFIETKPWYGLPHSTTIWCVEFQGALFIGSYGKEKKNWENNLTEQPTARLKINNSLYSVMITELSDETLFAAVDQAYSKKYDLVEVFGEEVPQWWYYRVEQIGR